MAKAADVQPLGFIGKPFIDEQIIAAIEPFVGSTLLRHGGSDVAEATRLAGYEAGSDPNKGVSICPWPPSDKRRDLRWAWLLGFAEGRVTLKPDKKT